MDILARSEAFPVLIHCTAGKGRTGLLVAILQLILGGDLMDVEEIGKEYSKSAQSFTTNQKNYIIHELEKQGLPPEFADSSPKVILETIKWIDIEYGGIERYLESIEVSCHQQDAVRNNLTVNRRMLINTGADSYIKTIENDLLHSEISNKL